MGWEREPYLHIWVPWRNGQLKMPPEINKYFNAVGYDDAWLILQEKQAE